MATSENAEDIRARLLESAFDTKKYQSLLADLATGGNSDWVTDFVSAFSTPQFLAQFGNHTGFIPRHLMDAIADKPPAIRIVMEHTVLELGGLHRVFANEPTSKSIDMIKQLFPEKMRIQLEIAPPIADCTPTDHRYVAVVYLLSSQPHDAVPHLKSLTRHDSTDLGVSQLLDVARAWSSQTPRSSPHRQTGSGCAQVLLLAVTVFMSFIYVMWHSP